MPAFKLEKQIVAKNLLKSLFWALSLGQSKYIDSGLILNVRFKIHIDPLVLSVDHARQLAKIGE